MSELNKQLLLAIDDKTYKEICYTIWGCVPIDVNWAVSTNIFKEAKQALKQ